MYCQQRSGLIAIGVLLGVLTPSVLRAQGDTVQTENLMTTSVKEIPTTSPEDVGMSSSQLAKVDEILRGYMEDGQMVGGIVMIARKGKICFFEDYGIADRENGVAMSKDSILRIYSMSKAITTAAALMLYDEGKLDVNAPVSTYLPQLGALNVITEDGIRPASKQMTVADLMRHTSGLTYGGSKNETHNKLFKEHDPNSREITLAVMPERLKHVPLRFEPTSEWEYGISTDVLGRVMEVASGQTLEAFLKQRLFEPLDMKDTGFHVPEEKKTRLAACYELTGENANENSKDDANAGFRWMQDEDAKFLKPPIFQSGGGGLVSTARDYMRFLMMIERGGEWNGRRYLKPATVKLMTTNQTPRETGWIRFGDEIRHGVGFGFGFSVRDEMSVWDPGGRVGEYGWGGAASTHYWISPKDELIVITFEQIRPYRWLMEFGVKQQIYDAMVE